MPKPIGNRSRELAQQIYAQRGFLVLNTQHPLCLGPIPDNCTFDPGDPGEGVKWKITGSSCESEFLESRKFGGQPVPYPAPNSFFYRIEAMD